MSSTVWCRNRNRGTRRLSLALLAGLALIPLTPAAPPARAAPEAVSPAPIHGALAAELSLYDLVTRADTIVHAHVVSSRVEPHPDFRNISTVVVTLRIESTLKGHPPALKTFRQFIWDPRDRLRGGGYGKGQELLLFLTRESAIGLSAPVGLDQGRIPLLREPAGGGAAMNPSVSGASADRMMRDFAPALVRHGIELPAGDRRILSRARGRPLSLLDIAALARAVDRPASLAPAQAAPESR